MDRQQRRFATPEEAALAGWAGTPSAVARVVAVQPCDFIPPGVRAAVYVTVQLGEQPSGFHDQDIVTCVQGEDGTWSDNGSTGASSR